MKAIILAAGIGNRMMPLTREIHKTLIDVAGTTIIDRIINSLKENNILDIVVVTGYLKNQLINHLKKTHNDINFEFVNNPKFKKTNNIFSLSMAFEQIEVDQDILLIESDLIYTNQVIKKAIKSKHQNVALVSPYKIGLDGTVVQVQNDQIINIYPPHLQQEKFDLTDKFKTLNIYKFSKDFCSKEFKKLLTFYANTIDDNCYYELILGILLYMQKTIINCEIIDNSEWAEVDDPNDLSLAEFQFNKESKTNLLQDSFGGYWNYDVIDFCFIRNMYYPTNAMIAEIKNYAPKLLTNYGSKQTILNKKLSYVLQYDSDKLIALNGATQIYPILKQLFNDKRALVPNPTFGEYDQLFLNSQKYYDIVGVKIDEIESKIDSSEVVVFVNPNNPTGSIVSTKWIYKTVQKNTDKLFIIDESFIEFSDEFSIVELLEKNALENIIVIRSMSKNYGLPGIRLGFIYTCNNLLFDKISSNIPIWNLNSVAEFYLEIILKNKIGLLESYEKTKRDRKEFILSLKKIDLIDKVYESGANFIFFSIRSSTLNSNYILNFLIKEHNIFIKDVSEKMNIQHKYFFRVAVRLPHENKNLIDAISDLEKKIVN
jgi:histidinol-phosphate/aromatic aminotransferase/cobyric acid decarboxylase-like protein/choline kinase